MQVLKVHPYGDLVRVSWVRDESLAPESSFDRRETVIITLDHWSRCFPQMQGRSVANYPNAQSICRALQAVLRDTGRMSSSRPLKDGAAKTNRELSSNKDMWPRQVKEDYEIIFKAKARTCWAWMRNMFHHMQPSHAYIAKSLNREFVERVCNIGSRCKDHPEI